MKVLHLNSKLFPVYVVQYPRPF